MKPRYVLLMAALTVFAAMAQPRPFRHAGVSPAVPFTWYGATFGGTNEYLTRDADLTGITNVQTGSFSLWAKMGTNSADTNLYHFLHNYSGRARIRRTTTAALSVLMYDTNDVAQVWLDTNDGSLSKTSGWVNVMGCWDTGTAGRRHLYVNGTEQTTANIFVASGIISYGGSTNWDVGQDVEGGLKLAATLSEMVFWTNYIDMTVQANREKIRTPAGKPGNMGATATIPTGGTAAMIYLRQQVPVWEVNAGTGGGFLENGILVDSGSDIP